MKLLNKTASLLIANIVLSMIFMRLSPLCYQYIEDDYSSFLGVAELIVSVPLYWAMGALITLLLSVGLWAHAIDQIEAKGLSVFLGQDAAEVFFYATLFMVPLYLGVISVLRALPVARIYLSKIIGSGWFSSWIVTALMNILVLQMFFVSMSV